MPFRVCIDTPNGRRYSPKTDDQGDDDGLTGKPENADTFDTFEDALEDAGDFRDPSRVNIVEVLDNGTEKIVPKPPMSTCSGCGERLPVDKALQAEIDKLRRTLTWYAWRDRYVPRFEGVGRVGIGGKYYPQVENDMGRMAREALGIEWCADYFYGHQPASERVRILERDEKISRKLIQEARAEVEHLSSLVIHWKHGDADPIETLERIAKSLKV